MLRRIYDATIALSTHRRAVPALGVVSFVESSVFPIPPDAMMVPMILARPDRAWIIAGVATIASVMGGIAGYGIGMFAFEQIGRPMLEALGKGAAMAEFSGRFTDAGFWAVLIAGLTPFPYKVITIMSGWTGLSLATFVATSVLARGLRFFIVAALLRVYGEPMRAFIERRLGLVFTLALAVLIGGFLMVRWL